MIPELDDRGVDAGQQVQVRQEGGRLVFQLFDGPTFSIARSQLQRAMDFFGESRGY